MIKPVLSFLIISAFINASAQTDGLQEQLANHPQQHTLRVNRFIETRYIGLRDHPTALTYYQKVSKASDKIGNIYMQLFY